MKPVIQIGTRESDLAMWQATLVQDMLADEGYKSLIIPVTSDGDQDQETPLYEMGVQGIFTKSLDTALLNQRIDVAVHSMKDVPTHLPAGILQAAVLKRGNPKDLFVLNDYRNQRLPEEELNSLDLFYNSLYTTDDIQLDPIIHTKYIVATSSTRRRAQWLHRYPGHTVENLRGNMNTRLQKVNESNWDGAIMAAAGLERINLRPKSAIELDWMLPAPTQGAIMVVCRVGDEPILKATRHLNHEPTQLCTGIEKDFLRTLMGGCTTPVGAYATIDKKELYFRGNILSLDGKQKIEVEKYVSLNDTAEFGLRMGLQLLKNGGREIADTIRNA